MNTKPVNAPPVKNSLTRKYSGMALKLGLTAGALYFVFKKIDFQQVLNTMANTSLIYFMLALVAFNISKIISAYRIKSYYQTINIPLSEVYNIKLLYLGMFYNLFLPGSIGGDGYKIYLLRQQFPIKTKYIISATLLDRISGLALLLLLTGLFLYFSSFVPPLPYFKVSVVLATLLILPVYYGASKIFFPGFLSKFNVTTHLSFWVQIGQVITAIFLLFAVFVQDHYVDYLTLFMVSSVVAIFPFTIGGVGARELVFLYGFNYLNINLEIAITFTLLFFFITAISSLFGLFFSYNLNK